MLDIHEERKKFLQETRERTAGYIIGAFSFVAGIAWNDAIRALIDYWFPLSKGANSIWLKFLYASLLTLIIVIVSLYIVRFLNKKKEEK